MKVSAPFELGLAKHTGIHFMLPFSESSLISPQESSQKPQQNAFSVLLESQTKTNVPPKYNPPTNNKERLHNDIINMLKGLGAGWTVSTMSSGKRTVSALTSALWYINGQTEKLKERNAFPSAFALIPTYRTPEKDHKALPKLEASRLKELTCELCVVLQLPSMASSKNTNTRETIENLNECILKYIRHLELDQVGKQTQILKDCTVNIGERSVKCIKPALSVEPQYREIDEAIKKENHKSLIFLDDFTPNDRYKRRHWLDNLKVSNEIVLYRVAYLNSLGTLNFVWSVSPEDSEDARIETNAELISTVQKALPKYVSRAVRKDFIEKYARHVKCGKALLRAIFNDLTGDWSAPENATQSVIDERVFEYLMQGDDAEILIDLRSNNKGTPKEQYQLFYDELQKFLAEQELAVHERRHGKELYMPFAISVQDLVNQIIERLPTGTSVPSTETVRLQFHPCYPNRKVSERYNASIDVKFKVQTRLARIGHEDAHYVATIWKYMKEFAVCYRDKLLLCCLDDKAIIPVGEPDTPITTNVRSHNRVLSHTDVQIVATDHDFHLAGLVPSVTLVIDIPDSAKESFFTGKIFVRTKDKIFQPSSPYRHASELIDIVRSKYSDDGISGAKPILAMYTDGGPDHRVTYETVKLSLVALFMELNMDMVIALRTAPQNSWCNPAERCMSILNLALQHCSLKREKMEEAFENKMKNKQGITAVRNQAEMQNGFKEAFLQSTHDVIDSVNKRFGRMKLKNETVTALSATTDENVENVLSLPKRFTNCADLTIKSSSAVVRGQKDLQAFIASHSRESHYCFQLRKCDDSGCSYCTENPPRNTLPEYLPYPMPDDSGDSYKEFSDIYGTPTSEAYRPSLISARKGHTAEEVDEDKRNREYFKSTKVKHFIKCVECGKPRCVFLDKKCTSEQEKVLARIKEEMFYVCGDSLGSEFVVRRALTCTSEIETVYFSSGICLPPVCVYCGSTDGLLDDFDEYISAQKELYSVVRPLCKKCKDSGKEAKTWGRKFAKKTRTD